MKKSAVIRNIAVVIAMIAVISTLIALTAGAEILPVPTVAPAGKVIENYSGVTYFDVGMNAGTKNEAVYALLKSGDYSLRVKISDETDMKVYEIKDYKFEDPSVEFYGTTYIRIAPCKYGIVPVNGHEYTVLLTVYNENGKVIAEGKSVNGQFARSTDTTGFLASGAITYAKPQYQAIVYDFSTIPAGKTEEELGVLPVGKYKISVVGYSGYLNYSAGDGQAISLSESAGNNIFTIVYQTQDDYPVYTLSPNDDVYRVLGLNRTYVSNGSTVMSQYRTLFSSPTATNRSTQDNYTSIRWGFEDNGDGSYKMVLYGTVYPVTSSTTKYYLCYDGSTFTVRSSSTASKYGVVSVKLEMVERGTSQFNQYISDGGVIALRLPPVSKSQCGLSDERAQLWANDVEDCYWKYAELTDYRPYENIIIKAYSNTTYMAYILGSSEGYNGTYNVVTISYSPRDNEFAEKKEWYLESISNMVSRGIITRDVDFCIMHEMGHMFDAGRGWNFDSEYFTDLKIPYVLGELGLAASPDSDPVRCYTAETLNDYSYLNGGDISKTWTYNITGADYRTLKIIDEVGWDVMKQVFRYYSSSSYVKYTEKYKKFEQFIGKISEYSGLDCKAMYPKEEWDVMMNYYGDPNTPNPFTEDTSDGAEAVSVSPSFGKIENWSGKTYFIVSITAKDNETLYNRLRDKTYTAKITIKDYQAQRTFVIDKYAFDDAGSEIYGSSFLRLAVCEYGIVPVSDREYGVRVEIYSGDTRIMVGHSADRAFESSNADFINNGAIAATVKHQCTVVCSEHEPAGASNCLTGLTCKYCGFVYVEGKAHTYVETVVAPGCVTKGYTEHTCTACGDSYRDNYTNATGAHEYDDGVVTRENTCTKSGILTQTCTKCGNKKNSIIKAGHDYVTVVTAPTCVSGGYTTTTCSRCGVSSVTDQLPADPNAHVLTEKVVAPTCTSKGYTVYSCTLCTHTYTANEQPELPHSYSNGVCTSCGTTDPNYSGTDNDGFVTENGVLYYYVNGEKQTGWFTLDGVRYYADPTTKAVVSGSNAIISTKQYLWDSEKGLVLANGFYENAGTNKYASLDTSNGKAVIVTVSTNGTICFENGYLVYGWRHVDGSSVSVVDGVYEQYSTNPQNLYYFLSSTYTMVTSDSYVLGGWTREFNADHTVKPLNGLQNRYGEVYYYVAGTMQDGWQTIDGNTYYFYKGTGKAATKWMIIGEKVYYFYAGSSATPYVLKTSGAIGGINYTYAEDGSITTTGFFNTAYANAANNNSAAYIQYKDGTTMYYENGVRVEGWAQIGGNWYYFYKGTGLMCTESRTIGGVWYEFTSEGVCTSK